MMLDRSTIHLVLHVVVPFFIAVIFYRHQWKKAWFLMMIGVVIDLDHLLADPIYAPNRCSLGFHPLHTLPAVGIYLSMLLPLKTRLLGIGLIVHLLLDGVDCWLMRLG